MSEQRIRAQTVECILFVRDPFGHPFVTNFSVLCSIESAMHLLACGCSLKKSPEKCPRGVPATPRVSRWKVHAGNEGGGGEHVLRFNVFIQLSNLL